MSRWKIPRPEAVTEDSELWLVNVLLSAIIMVALDSVRPAGGTPEEAHALTLKLVRRGYENLLKNQAQMSEDGIEDWLQHLRKELE